MSLLPFHAFAMGRYFPQQSSLFFPSFEPKHWVPATCSQTSVAFIGYLGPFLLIKSCRCIRQSEPISQMSREKPSIRLLNIYTHVLKLADTCVCPQERTVCVQVVCTFAGFTVSSHGDLRRFVSNLCLLTFNNNAYWKILSVDGYHLDSQALGFLS